MARKAQVRYFDSRGAYFTTYRGRQHKLATGPDDAPNGPTYLAALAAFRGVMELGQADTAGNANTVRAIFDLYAQNLERRDKLRTLKVFKQVADSAVEDYGDTRVSDLKPVHVEAWLHRMAQPRTDTYGRTVQWAKDSRFAVATIRAAFNWAKKKGLIADHCLGAVDTAPARSKGEEAYVPRDVFDKFAAATNQNFRDLLLFLRDTGCRPDEAYHVEARYYHPADKCVVYSGDPKGDEFVWKNAKKHKNRKVDRIIYLTDELAAMVEARIRRYPTGPIFRTNRGTRWGRESVGIALRWLNEKKVKGSLVPTAYGLRHTYATNFLLAGGSIKVLADLMGTSVTMLEKHYAHLSVDRGRMRSIMLAVMGAAGSAETPSAVAGAAPSTSAGRGAGVLVGALS